MIRLRGSELKQKSYLIANLANDRTLRVRGAQVERVSEGRYIHVEEIIVDRESGFLVLGVALDESTTKLLHVVEGAKAVQKKSSTFCQSS